MAENSAKHFSAAVFLNIGLDGNLDDEIARQRFEAIEQNGLPVKQSYVRNHKEDANPFQQGTEARQNAIDVLAFVLQNSSILPFKTSQEFTKTWEQFDDLLY